MLNIPSARLAKVLTQDAIDLRLKAQSVTTLIANRINTTIKNGESAILMNILDSEVPLIKSNLEELGYTVSIFCQMENTKTLEIKW